MEISILKFSRKAFCIGLIYSFLVSCGSDPQPNALTPVLLQTIPIKFKVITVNRDIIAVVSDDGYLKLFRQDPVNPDFLSELSAINFGYQYFKSTSLNSQWATFVLPTSNNFIDDTVVLIDVTDQVNASLVAELGEDSLPELVSFLTPIHHAVAYENFLLLIISELESITFVPKPRALLLDISIPTAPVLKRNYELVEFLSTVFALEGGFFMITVNGYAYVDVSNPINILLKEVVNEDLASTVGVLEGEKYFFVGSKSNSTIKIGRFDLSRLEAPVLEVISNSIEIDPQGFRFAYDGVNQDYYIKEIDSIKVYKETNGVFGLQKAVKFKKDAQLYGLFYVWNGRIYTSRFDENLYVYRMPE